MVNKFCCWPIFIALLIILASCSEDSSSNDQPSPAPGVADEIMPTLEPAAAEAVPAEAVAVPPTLEASIATSVALAPENSSLPELYLAQRWRHDTALPVFMMDFVSMDGLPFPDIAAVTEDGQVLTLSINDRSYWDASISKPPLALAAGQVYGRANGDVAVSNEANGIQLFELSDVDKTEELLWEYTAPSNVTALAFVEAEAGSSGAGLLAGTDNGLLLVLDTATVPQPMATVQAGNSAVRFIESLAGAEGERNIAVLTEAGVLSAVSEQGEILWQKDVMASPSRLSTADLNDNGQPGIIVGTTAGDVIAFDQAGTELWRWHSDHSIEAVTSARLGNGTHVLAGSDGQLTALSSAGAILWQYQYTDSVIKAVDNGDIDLDEQVEIIIGTGDGLIWVLEENGQIRGKHEVGIPIDGLKLINIDGESVQPELVVWGGSAIFLFDVERASAVEIEPEISSDGDFSLDEEPRGDLPHYAMDVVLDVDTHHAQVRQVTSIKNTSDEVWEELVFHVAPVYWPGIFTLNDVTVQMDDETTDVTSRFELTMLHIPLFTPLEPGEDVKVDFNFELDLPQLNPVGWGPTGNAGWGPAVIQMGDWYPALVPYQAGSGWRTWQYKPVGDPVISRRADYDVVLRPSSAVTIGAPGLKEEFGDGSKRFRLDNARAFSFLTSPYYVRQDGNAGGVPVTVYTTAGYKAAGAVVLDTAIKAINLFSELYGPYPYQELIIAENGFLTAMEYSGLVSLSGFAFDAYDGTASSLLVAITAHEVAHQWWYGAVGNDQVYEPWLDEGLAMMSELLYYERFYPDLTSWWWDYRVNRWNPVGYVDDTIYDYPDSERFVHNVYGMAAYFMDELRAVMGPEVFKSFLQDYLAQNRDGFVSRDDFFTAVKAHTDADIGLLIDKYFKVKGP